MRQNRGDAEQRLWQGLRRNAIGFRFRSQYAFRDYDLDFYCPEARLAVEVDGDMHNKTRDKKRDDFFAEHGIETLRISTGDLYPSIRPALEAIYAKCVERTGREPFPD